MTYIPGIEGLHSWTPAGADEPAITLGEGPYRLLEISGLGSLGESEPSGDAIVGAVGERLRPSEQRGKSLAYVGRIIASSLLELREAEAALRAAFAGRGVGRMDLAAHPDNAELAGQSAKFYEAKALSCDVIDKQDTKGWGRPFVIGLRMGDPRVFDETSEVHEVEVTDSNSAVEW